MRGANTYLGSIGTTIFTVMSALAIERGSINLGQGFPDTDGPDDIIQAAADALKDGRNQYPPMPGVPELRQAVAAANRRFHGIDVDWASEVTVTSGGTEAIAACLMAVLDPGASPHPPHRHPEEETVIIASGTGEIYCDGKTSLVGPGAIMYCAGNVEHGILNTGSTPMVFYWHKWTAKGFE